MRAPTRLGLVLLITLSSVITTSASPLTDTEESPYKQAIRNLQTQGIINGYEDGTFKPDQHVNRAELVKILALGGGIAPAINRYHDCFPDVTDQWFAPHVCYAKEQGWIKGYDDGTFKPAQTITMAEALKIMMHAFAYVPARSSPGAASSGISPGEWYAPYVLLASEANIVQFEGPFQPDEMLTRGKAADMIYRCILKKNADTPGSSGSASISSAQAPSSASQSRRRGGGGGANNANAQSSSEAALSAPVVSLGNISKNYGDSSFILSPTSNSAGAFSFISSNTSVATIAGNTVTIVGAGTTTITVNQAANGDFAAGSTTATLTVSTVAPIITFNSISKTYGDAAFALTPVSDSAGSFSFISSNTSVATVTGSTVTIIGAGSTTITATQAANGNYLTGSSATTLTVAKATPVIASIDDISVLSRDYTGVCLVDPDAFIASCDNMGYLMLDLPASTSTADYTSLTAPDGSVIDVSSGSFDYAGFLNIVADFRYGFTFDNGSAAYPDALTTTATLHQASNANFNAGSGTFTITITPTNLNGNDDFYCLNWGVYLQKSSGGECMCQADFGGAQCEQFIGI